MRPIVLTIDAIYTNAALQHAALDFLFITDDDATCSKMQNGCNGLPWGLPPRGSPQGSPLHPLQQPIYPSILRYAPYDG